MTGVPAHASGPLAELADEDSASYWAALAEHRIVLQRCDVCRRLRFPPGPRCPYCGSPRSTPEENDGHGEVYSYVRVHRAMSPEMRDAVPYVVATITLDGGPRVLARIEDDRGGTAIGERVRPVFVDHDGWTELRYAAERRSGEVGRS
jgi:uncharacterized OB-fold protein